MTPFDKTSLYKLEISHVILIKSNLPIVALFIFPHPAKTPCFNCAIVLKDKWHLEELEGKT